MKVIYGPVPSWRFGRSLGVDPVCIMPKICSFDCIYCQLGKTAELTTERKEYAKLSRMKKELDEAPKDNIDVITFSGTSEPTLNSKIGEMIKYAKKFGFPVYVLTNASFIFMESVREDLSHADLVSLKLDAPNQEIFEKVNKPADGITFKKVLEGLKKFREEYDGIFALQIMFVNENKDYAKEIAETARELKPDLVQLDTPLRPSAAKPLSEKEMQKIEKHFKGMKYTQVYEEKKPDAKPLDIHETYLRRPERQWKDK